MTKGETSKKKGRTPRCLHRDAALTEGVEEHVEGQHVVGLLVAA